MGTQGVGTFAINSFWESGRLIFYEKAYGHTTTGDVFILGADYVQVGDTANDVNFVWKGDTTGTFTLDAGAHTLALTGMATSTDGNIAITGTGKAVLGTSGAKLVLTAGSPIFTLYSTCASTGTDGTPVTINHTLSAAGGVGVGFQTDVGVTLAGGNYVAALYGVLTFATAGRITGIASGVNGEVVLSAGTTQGTYCGLNSELVANSAVSSGTATSFLYANIAGSNSTGKTTLNTNGYLFELGAGVVDTTNGLLDVATITPTSVEFDARLRIRIGGVDYFIPLGADAAFE